jgi:hypothetical protein
VPDGQQREPEARHLTRLSIREVPCLGLQTRPHTHADPSLPKPLGRVVRCGSRNRLPRHEDPSQDVRNAETDKRPRSAQEFGRRAAQQDRSRHATADRVASLQFAFLLCDDAAADLGAPIRPPRRALIDPYRSRQIPGTRSRPAMPDCRRRTAEDSYPLGSRGLQASPRHAVQDVGRQQFRSL